MQCVNRFVVSGLETIAALLLLNGDLCTVPKISVSVVTKTGSESQRSTQDARMNGFGTGHSTRDCQKIHRSTAFRTAADPPNSCSKTLSYIFIPPIGSLFRFAPLVVKPNDTLPGAREVSPVFKRHKTLALG